MDILEKGSGKLGTPRKLTPVTWMHFYAPFFLVHAGLYGTKLLPNAAGAL